MRQKIFWAIGRHERNIGMQISIKKIVFRLLLVIGKVECYSPIISFKEGSVLLIFTWSWLIGSFFRMLALSSPFASSFGRSLHHPESLPHVTFVVESYRQVYSRGFIPGVLMTVLLDEIMVSVIKEDPKLIWSFLSWMQGLRGEVQGKKIFQNSPWTIEVGCQKINVIGVLISIISNITNSCSHK